MFLLLPALMIAVLAAVAALAGVIPGGRLLLGVILPYAGLGVFILGIGWRVYRWAATPVPFHIPTTCGQQRSLPWIKDAPLDNPSTTQGVVGRLLLEVLLFRSLFRNHRSQLWQGKYVFADSKYLWFGALVFHWALLIVLLRHLRLLVEPVPAWVTALSASDGFFQVGAPVLYLTDPALLLALGYLLLRRLRDPWLRYISQFSDYFALLLLLGIALSGAAMRYLVHVDVIAVKRFALGLATFQPILPEGLSPLFLIHLLLITTLAAYFPFSKLVHLGAALLSPTRNLANNSRAKRHLNPWNAPVKTHTYPEWEAEFHDKLKLAGIPLDEDSHG